MQTIVNAIRTAKDISLADVQMIVAALHSAVNASIGSHLQPQQVVLDSLADLSNWLQDELTEQEQQSALEAVEFEKMKKSALAKSWGFGESLQALQGLSIRSGV
jgi:ribosome maturation factor RimP